MKRLQYRIAAAAQLIAVALTAAAPAPAVGDAISASDYASIQEALDKNPGKAVFVPPGDWEISEPIFLRTDGAELYGAATVIQTNPDRAIVRVDGVKRAAVRGLTLTRPEGKRVTGEEAVRADNCEFLTLDGIKAIDNQTKSAAIRLENCSRSRIQDCLVLNYKRIDVDDRTDSEHYGYAFQCINGHGIIVERGQGIVIEGNQVIEERLSATRETKEEFGLGRLVEGAKPSKPGALSKAVFERGSVNNWHQGSAILVTSPESARMTRIVGNQIENCAQGIDIHADELICSENQIRGAMIGIKAMHGSSNLIISNNMILRADLWGIMLGPGTGSHGAEDAREGRPGRAANADGGTIISGNLIADYGLGQEYWNWGGATTDQAGSYAIRLDRGQLPANPPLADVLIVGNMVYDSAKRSGPGEGAADTAHASAKPRYRLALFVERSAAGDERKPTAPTHITVRGNHFDPGSAGISNIEIAE